MKEDTAGNHDGEPAWWHDEGEENEKKNDKRIHAFVRPIVLGQSPKRTECLSWSHFYLYGLVAWGHKLLAGLKEVCN